MKSEYTSGDNMRTNKLICKLLTCAIVSLVFLNGCGSDFSSTGSVQDRPVVNTSREKEYHPEKNAKKEAVDYFEYLKKKDIQSLNDLFSSDVQASHDLKMEWEAFFNALEGNIVSYENISYLGEEVRIDDHKVSYSDITIRYENVKTDTGKIYKRLDYRQLRVDNTHPDAEGISIFSLAVPADNSKGFEEVNVGEPFNE